MPVNLFVRKSYSAVAFRKAVNEYLDPKIRSIRKDKEVDNLIAKLWAETVKPFVPYSGDHSVIDHGDWVEIIDEPHHLRDYTVSDGRVIWTRKADADQWYPPVEIKVRKGEEIAHYLYDGKLSDRYYERYPGHMPQKHWDEAVRPGTWAWEDFIKLATPEIIKKFREG